MQDGRVSAVDAAKPVPHAATPQWQSFEMRMRARRADRCARQARLALDAGRMQEAADALDEARQLSPLSPGVEELTRAMAVATAADAQPISRSRYRQVVLWSAVLAAVLLGSSVYWSRSSKPPEADEPPPPARLEALVRLPGVPVVLPKNFETGQVADDSREPEPPPASPPPQTRMSPAPADVRAADAIRTPVLLTPPTPARPVPAPTDADVLDRARTPAAPIPAVRPITAPEPIAPPVPTPAMEARELPVPAAAAASAPIHDPRAAIRATLGRYESAYTQLDASAVQAVWPSLDHRALARAFEGLASQRVTLGSCDVNVTGGTARANCSGTAAWTPKVGGGSRSTSRRWVFDLTQADGTWRIVRVDAR